MALPPFIANAPRWSDDDLVPYGLLSAATVEDNASGLILGGGIRYPYRCDPETGSWPAACEDVPAGLTKTRPGGMDLVAGDPFPIYAFETCPLIDHTQAQAEDWAEDSLRRTEQCQVEARVWSLLRARTDTQVLATTPVSIVDAAALASWWLGRQCTRGMFHINAIGSDIALSEDILVASRDGRDYWRSAMGHRWVFGGGYGLDGPNDPALPNMPANTAWMFVTRQITLHRSRIRRDSGFLARANEFDARAERVYVPVIPCQVAAIPVATVVDGTCQPLPIPVPVLGLQVTPDTGMAPLTVQALITNAQQPLSITWGDETP